MMEDRAAEREASKLAAERAANAAIEAAEREVETLQLKITLHEFGGNHQLER